MMDTKGRKHAWLLMGFLILIVFQAPLTQAQQNPAAPSSQSGLADSNLYKAAGELLTKGDNQLPVGPLKVKSYRLEEVKLPRPMKSGIESALRLVVTLDNPLNRTYVIWVDDLPYNAVPTKIIGFRGSKESELSALSYGRSFEDGAEIAVSQYATGSNSEALSTLPERLRLPTRLKAAATVNSLKNDAIKLRNIPGLLRGQEKVEIRITTPGSFGEARNAIPMLRIGKQEITFGHAFGHQAVFELTSEQFARAENGAWVFVKIGGDTWRIGRLNKSLLDK